MRKIHYSWIVCAMGTLLIFVTMGMISNCFSVYMPFIMSEYGLTNAQTSSLVTLRCLVSFFSMLSIGFYYKKFSLRTGTVIAAALAALTFLIYSVASTYHGFCIGAAVSGMSYGLGSMIPVSILMNRWFVEHRALALGIVGTGSGLATIILPAIVTLLVEQYSMRVAFAAECVAVVLITALIFVFIRNYPEEKGIKALGAEKAALATENAARAETAQAEANANGQATKAASPAAVPVSRGLSLRNWILLGIVSMFMGAVANPGFAHLSVLFSSEGFDSMIIAAAISMAGLIMVISKIIYGQTTDRIGGFRSTVLFGSILCFGHVLCCLAFTGSTVLCLFTTFCLGLGYPIATIGPSVWANDMVTEDQFPVVVRRLQIIYAGGALLFASVPGIMADITGKGYIPSYIMFTVMMGTAVVLAVLAYKDKRLEK